MEMELWQVQNSEYAEKLCHADRAEEEESPAKGLQWCFFGGVGGKKLDFRILYGRMHAIACKFL